MLINNMTDLYGTQTGFKWTSSFDFALFTNQTTLTLVWSRHVSVIYALHVCNAICFTLATFSQTPSRDVDILHELIQSGNITGKPITH